MNAGGIRGDLLFPSSAAGEGDGNVTYGEAFTVQPFGNSLVTMTLHRRADRRRSSSSSSPAEPDPAGLERVLVQLQRGAPVGSKVDPQHHDERCRGDTRRRPTASPSTASWPTAATTYATFRDGTNRIAGNVDTDAFENYLKANLGGSRRAPQNRIILVP